MAIYNLFKAHLKNHGGKGFLNGGAFSRKRLRERFITFASAVYNVCIRGCKRYPWWTHVFAFKVDQIGPGGCSALRGRLQCTASEKDKNRHRNRQPYSGIREYGRKTHPIRVTVVPGNTCLTLFQPVAASKPHLI